MSLLIIQPNLTSKEAHEWLALLFIQILDAIDPFYSDIDNLIYQAKVLNYKDVDAIFEKAMEGLLK